MLNCCIMINLQFNQADKERFTPEFTHSSICFLNGLRNSLMSTSSFYFPCEAREIYQVRRELLLELVDDSLRLLNHQERLFKINDEEL